MAKVLKAQPGPQTKFLSTQADVVVYGGGAGAAKTYSVLLDNLRYITDPNYKAVIFRRTNPMLTAPGSIWQESGNMYQLPGIDGVPKESKMTWNFPAGAEIKFSHMEHEKNKYDWQGSQLTGVYFDEATHFTEGQVMYMLSRLRSDAHAEGFMRLTCNPDRNSFVRRWIDWYLDDGGFPIHERGGVIRYFIVLNDEMIWEGEDGVSSPESLAATYGEEWLELAMSFTFIPALITDNPILMQTNPRYLASLKALPRIEREALLDGCWDVQEAGGMYFNRDWVEVVDRCPRWEDMDIVRYWDRASSVVSEKNKNPDYTVGGLFGRHRATGDIYVIHMDRFRATPSGVRERIEKNAEKDHRRTRIVLEQDPGQAGVSDVANLAMQLEKYDVRSRRVTKDKLTRFLPFSAACENGRVKIVRGSWNEEYFKELEGFSGDPKSLNKDDQIDVSSGAYNEFNDYMMLPGKIILPALGKDNGFVIS